MTKAAELAKMGEVLTNSQIGGRRNVIINGAMNVAQRSVSETGLGASGGYFTCDRIFIDFVTSGRLTQSQATVTDLPGFANALKLECTTADTSIAASENAILQYRIEGQDLQQFKKGTSDAEKMTISFYVKGNGNATYICELYDADNSRSISQTFSVTSSWTRVVLTYDGDTTGAFDDDNALSLYILFWIHSGSSYNSGTLSTTWSSVTQANRAVGVSSFFSSTDNTFFITGIQLEVGSVATPFEHRSFAEELALCQRYFQYHVSTSTAARYYADQYSSGTLVLDQHHSPMRAVATGTVIGTWTISNITGQPSLYVGTEFSHYLARSVSSTGRAYFYAGQNDGVSLDAEL